MCTALCTATSCSTAVLTSGVMILHTSRDRGQESTVEHVLTAVCITQDIMQHMYSLAIAWRIVEVPGVDMCPGGSGMSSLISLNSLGSCVAVRSTFHAYIPCCEGAGTRTFLNIGSSAEVVPMASTPPDLGAPDLGVPDLFTEHERERASEHGTSLLHVTASLRLYKHSSTPWRSLECLRSQ